MTYGHVMGIGPELIRFMRKMAAAKPVARKGKRRGKAKMPDDDVLELRREYLNGGYDSAVLCGVVAGVYDMHWSTVRQILANQQRIRFARTDPRMVPVR